MDFSFDQKSKCIQILISSNTPLERIPEDKLLKVFLSIVKIADEVTDFLEPKQMIVGQKMVLHSYLR